MSKRSLILSAGVGLAVAATGVATGAIPTSTTGVINACYDASGTVKVIDKEAGATCPTGTRALDWNAAGRTGPTGPRGADGAPYFVKVLPGDSGTWKNTGALSMRTWSYSDGAAWINVPSTSNKEVDVRKCVVVGTPVTERAGANVVRAPMDYKDWVLLYTAVGTTRTQFPIDVSLSC